MSSYQEEFRKGYEEGLVAGRVIANQMYQDGKEAGLKELREFDDKDKTVYYHLTKIFTYLGVEKQPKLVDKYKTYLLEESKSFNG